MGIIKINLNVERSYYDRDRKICVLTMNACWRYGVGCDSCNPKSVKSVPAKIYNLENADIDILKQVPSVEQILKDTEAELEGVSLSSVLKEQETEVKIVTKPARTEEILVVCKKRPGIFARLKAMFIR